MTKRRIILASLWLAGSALVWWALPIRPSLHPWQPPAELFAVGFVDGGRLLVTLYRDANESIPTERYAGIVQVWEVEGGALVGAYGSAADGAQLTGGKLHVSQSVAPGTGVAVVQVLDARTGRHCSSYQLQGGPSGMSRTVAPDGRLLAYAGGTAEQPEVLWHDLETDALIGRVRLANLPSYAVFSRDHRRFAAVVVRPGNTPHITVWDVPSGRVLAAFAVPTGPYALREFSPGRDAAARFGRPRLGRAGRHHAVYGWRHRDRPARVDLLGGRPLCARPVLRPIRLVGGLVRRDDRPGGRQPARRTRHG